MSQMFLRRRAIRAGALLAGTAMASATLVAVATPGYAVTPKAPAFASAAIENLSPYQPQKTCAPTARPGVIKFRALILKTYQGTGDDGIVRACKIGGTSEHKEGRAWDWAVSVKNTHQVAQVKALFTWLFASDSHGNRYAMARRLGIMYIIWNKKIWGAYASSAGWRPYSCSGVTGCHQDHVHFSFNWAGARAQTSFWSRKVVNVGGSPGNGGTHTGGGSTGNGGSGGTTGNGGGWTGPPSNGGDGWQPPTIPTLPDSALPKTVTVPVDRTVTTSYALAAGHHYLLTVTGSYPLGTVHNWSGDATTLYADAHCMQQPQWHTGEDPTWVSAPDIDADWANQLFELTVNRQSSWAPTVDSGTGCNPSTHTYAMHFTPQSTQRLWLQVIGGDHADGGTLKVTISKDTAN